MKTAFAFRPGTVMRSHAAWSRAGLPIGLFAWFAATAWIRPLAMPDEGRYTVVAWEMLMRGDWALPTLDGLPFFHKPPLFYWVSAAAMQVVGASAWAARMPSMLAAAALAWALYRFTTAWSSKAHARNAIIVIATMPGFYLGSQFANMDMLVAACIGGCVLLAAHAALSIANGRDARAAVWGAWAVAGLGFLAKGLIGFVLPGAIVMLWLVLARRASLILRLLSPVGFATFLLIVLPWPLAMEARHPGFLDYFIVDQHFRRFAASTFNNPQPWWFYVPVLFVLTLPWSLGLRATWKRLRQPETGPLPLRLLMLCWLGVVLVFFSLPHSKLIGYVLPAVPPVASLVADAIAARQLRSVGKDHLRALAAGSAVVLLAAIAVYGMRAPNSARALAPVLSQQRQSGEPVVFVDTYPYDLAFQARIQPPIPVVLDWHGPKVQGLDNWAGQLLDAGRFDATASARTLVQPDALPGILAASHRTWVVGSPWAAQAVMHDVPGAQVVAHTPSLILWRVDR